MFDDSYIDDLFGSIKTSVVNDVGVALRGYCNEHKEGRITSGFFAVPRMLFPEIDGMGAYITGDARNTSGNIEKYLCEVMSRIDDRYSRYAKFMSTVYRHGLLHQHEPKNCMIDGRTGGWSFVISNPNNPIDFQRTRHHMVEVGVFDQTQIKNNPFILQTDMTVFYEDVVASIDLFVIDVKGRYRSSFENARSEQLKVCYVNGLVNSY